MNHEREQRDIHVKINSTWIPASDETLKMVYTQYKNKPTYHPELPYSQDGIKIYRDENNHYNPTYAAALHLQNQGIRGESVPIPIIDMNDVKVFLTDLPSANWVKARDYQAWAYRDFIYDPNRTPVKYYASRYSSHLVFQTSNYRDVTTIELDGLPPNIVFKMSRNENGSVYYERNDSRATRVRICDNDSARSGYLGYYRRMTDVGDFIISSPPPAPAPVSSDPYGPDYQDFAAFLHQPQHAHAHAHAHGRNKLPLPFGATSIETNVEEEQCIMCFKNKSSLRLNPCGHKIICPECYTKIEKPECPVCRGQIQSLQYDNN
jgi:hypothetical protein